MNYGFFAVKKLGQTYDAAMVIFNQLPKERQEELRKEYEREQGR